jgi:hypothetical protein
MVRNARDIFVRNRRSDARRETPGAVNHAIGARIDRADASARVNFQRCPRMTKSGVEKQIENRRARPLQKAVRPRVGVSAPMRSRGGE